MDDLADKIAQLESLRAMLGDMVVNAALDALRAEDAMQKQSPSNPIPHNIPLHMSSVSPPATGVVQLLQIGSGGQNVNSPMTSVEYAEQITINPPPPDPLQVRQQHALLTYLRRILVECNALPLGYVDPADAAHARPLELARVYIGLQTTAQIELTKEEQQHQSPEEQAQLGARQTRPLTVLEALTQAEHGRLMLLGAPGSGKSTLTNHLTLCLAGAALCQRVTGAPQPEGGWLAMLPGWTHGPLLPVRIFLRDFAAFISLADASRGSTRLLRDFLAAILSEADCAEALEPLITALEDGQAILLLDGLDEVIGDVVLPYVVDSVVDAARSYARSLLLVTCRTFDYQAEQLRQLPGFPTQMLADLTNEQIQQFVIKWYAELIASGRRSTAQAQDDTITLQQALNTRAELCNLARLPLLLTVMALVHTNKGALPDARALLYAECVDLLLLRWRQPRGGPDLLSRLGLSQFRSSDLLALMARLGFCAHELARRSDLDPTRSADLLEHEVIELLAQEFAFYDPIRPSVRVAVTRRKVDRPSLFRFPLTWLFSLPSSDDKYRLLFW